MKEDVIVEVNELEWPEKNVVVTETKLSGGIIEYYRYQWIKDSVITGNSVSWMWFDGYKRTPILISKE